MADPTPIYDTTNKKGNDFPTLTEFKIKIISQILSNKIIEISVKGETYVGKLQRYTVQKGTDFHRYHLLIWLEGMPPERGTLIASESYGQVNTSVTSSIARGISPSKMQDLKNELNLLLSY